MVASGWKTTSLPKLLSTMKSGGTPNTSRADFYGGEIPFVSIEDMTSCEKYLHSTRKMLTHAGLDGSNAWLVPSNSILYSIYATLGVPRINLVPVATNQAILAMICRPQLMDQGFLYYWLNYARESLVSANSSQTTQKNLSKSVIGTFSVDHPSAVPEQSKIAEVLSTVDRAIAQTEALIAKQQRVKTGLMQDLLTRGIDEHGHLRSEATHAFKGSPLGRIPVEWEVAKLSDVAELNRGKFTHRPRDDARFYGGAYPFIQTGDVAANVGRAVEEFSQTLSIMGTRVSKEFPKGTIAITIAANIADTAILGRPMYFPDSVVGAVVKQPNIIRFIEMTVRSKKSALEQLAPKSAQSNINLEALRPLAIALPKPDEQARIASAYDADDDRQISNERSVRKLRHLKIALMQDLLTGKVRVTPLLEPAGEAVA